MSYTTFQAQDVIAACQSFMQERARRIGAERNKMIAEYPQRLRRLFRLRPLTTEEIIERLKQSDAWDHPTYRALRQSEHVEQMLDHALTAQRLGSRMITLTHEDVRNLGGAL